MKAKKCVLTLNSKSGYIFRPLECKSISSAKKIAKWNIALGFAWAYKIKVLD